MPEKAENHSQSYIMFELAGTTFGLRSEDVQHMEMVEHITSVPNASPLVAGVVYSRGQVIPAIDLRLRFGFPRKETTPHSRLIVVRIGPRSIGMIVDAAREFRNIAAEAIQPPDEAIQGLSGKYLQGIALLGERLIFLLDINEIFNLREVTNPRLTTEQAVVA